MEITEAFDIAKDFLATHNIINCGCMHYTYRAKGSELPLGRPADRDEWSLCFIQDKEEGVVIAGGVIIVIVDIESKTARYLSSA
jgi:hypothetical protein